jgi:P-type E1-E2 ATPase
MLHVSIPAGEDLSLEHLVLDVNGTLADRGRRIEAAAEALAELRQELALHVLSADTFGTAEKLAGDVGADFRRVSTGADKLAYLEWLGAEKCVAVGNGRNDAAMLRSAALGIAVIGPEGAHAAAVAAADVLTRSVEEALALVADPRALTATLRP